MIVRRPAGGPPAFNAPPVVLYTGLLNIVIFLLIQFLPANISAQIFLTLAYIPARFTQPDAAFIDPIATLLSPIGYSILHADWIHLLVNMGLFLAFGSGISRRLTSGNFLFLYITGALGGAAAITFITPQSITPMIGASAAVSAMIGALAMLAFFPRDYEGPPSPFGNRKNVLIFVIFWLGINLLTGLLPGLLGADAKIAWEAHLGGFFCGAFAIRFLSPAPPDKES